MAGYSDPGSWVSLFSSGLNNLAAGSILQSAAITAEQVGSKDKFYIKLRGELASFTPSTGSGWLIHFLANVDGGSDYADPCLGTRIFPCDFQAGAGIKRIAMPRRLIQASSFKLAFEHTSTTALAASGHLIEYQMDTAS